MTDSEIVDQGCGALMRLGRGPQPRVAAQVRHWEGFRTEVPLGVEEIGSQLDDPFAQRLLADGEFPQDRRRVD